MNKKVEKIDRVFIQDVAKLLELPDKEVLPLLKFLRNRLEYIKRHIEDEV